MKTLDFERTAAVLDGRRVRRACFVERSLLPVSAACVVANGVRESLGVALGVPVSLRLLQPVLPDRDGWSAISANARVWSLRGSVAEAALVLRPFDALELVGAAFGERAENVRCLSPLEDRVIAGAVRAVAGALTPLCGVSDLAQLRERSGVHGFTTYFELLMEQPASFRMGVALLPDPQPANGPAFKPRHFAEVPLALRVQVGQGSADSTRLLQLQRGEIVALETPLNAPALLCAGTRTIARGDCGIVNDRRVLVVGSR